jgi:tetratricopeptide (TPR) repeat protein
MDFKRIIDDNRPEIIRVLMIYGLCLGVLLVIQVFTGGVPVFFLLIAPVVMAVTVMFVLNKFGNAFGRGFYGGRQKPLSVDELAKCELDKIRFSKMNGRFEEAIQMINELLKKAPDYPEALFLKAQIYHEVYGYDESARKYLEKIIDMVSGDKEVRRWAANYLGKVSLTGAEKKRQYEKNRGDNKGKGL